MRISKNVLIALLTVAILGASVSYYISNIETEKKENENVIYNKENTKEIEKKEVVTSQNVIAETPEETIIETSIDRTYVVDNNKTSDDNIIEYFSLNEQEVDKMNSNEVLTKGKEIVVKLVDFIYYDTEINGVKFNDLKQSTKDKLLSILSNIDQKIESKAPGYKEKIKDYSSRTYTFLKDKFSGLVTKVDDSIASKVDEEQYSETKEDFKEAVDNLKEGFSNAGEITKDVISTGKDKLKSWYEGWR